MHSTTTRAPLFRSSIISFLVLALLLFAGQAAATDFYLPCLIGTQGWESKIILINTDISPVSGTLTVKTATGEEVRSCDLLIPLKGRVEVNTGDECLPAVDGYAVFSSSSPNVVGSIKFSLGGHSSGSVPMSAMPLGDDLYMAMIASNADQLWTGGVFLNNTDQQRDLLFTFNDGQTKSLELGPGEQRIITIRSLFDNQPQPNLRSAVISNASGVAGVQLIGDLAMTMLVGLPLSDNTATSLVFPFVAQDDIWFTGIIVYNPSPEAATLSILWYANDGQLLTTITPHLLAPGENLVSLPTALGYPPQCDSCWLRIESSQPVTGFILYAHSANMDGYAAIIPGTDGILPNTTRPGVTGVALALIVDTDMDQGSPIILEALDAIGNVTASVEMEVPAFGMMAGFMEDLFPGQDTSAAEYVRYRSTRGKIAAFQLRVSEDGETMTALPGMDATVVSSRVDALKRLLPESLYNQLTAGSRNNPGCVEHWNWQALGLPSGPNGQWYYTYENMIQGMASLANFANEGDENRRKLEIAAFLANVAQETGTHDPSDSHGGPGCYIQEGSGVYWKSENCGALAPSGAGYCGRGPHQLTWAVNYRDFGRDVGVGDAYLNDPDILTKNPAVGIMGSIWFWGRTEYTDQSGAIPFKPAAHDVATGNWTPTEKDIACGRTSANFGVIINLINGGLECGASATGPGRQGALNRVRYLQSIAQAMDVVIPDGFIDDCGNQQNFRDCTSF